MDISLSRGIRSNLLTLQGIADGRVNVQGRLATGKKVNSALDNPVNFFTAQGLNNRAADLTGLLDGMSNAVQTIQAADKGIKAINDVLKSAQAKVKEGLQNVSPTAGTATAAFTVNATAAQNITLQINGTTVTATVAAGGTIGAAVTEINKALGTNGSVAVSGTNGLVFSNNTTQSLTVGGSLTATVGAATQDFSKYAKMFNDLLKEVDGLAKDASFNGQNLLRGDNLKVILNEKVKGQGLQEFDVKGTDISAKALGIDSLKPDAKAATKEDFEKSLDQLQKALNTLRDQSSEFGSNLSVVQTRQTFTKEMTNVLKNGADNLTLADQNEEGANLLSLNTRAQLATSAMSFASQADQQVLQFLR